MLFIQYLRNTFLVDNYILFFQRINRELRHSGNFPEQILVENNGKQGMLISVEQKFNFLAVTETL